MIEDDLKRWRDAEAAYLPGVPREGDWLWSEAREHAEQAEARLAVLAEHEIVPAGYESALTAYTVGCRVCDYDDAYGQVSPTGPCRTVRLLASGYRHRPGYQDRWVP